MKIRLLVLLFVAALLVPTANALPTGALPGWSGEVYFDLLGLDGRTLTGWIDYAVYEFGSYPGTVPAGGSYIYAYQIFNQVFNTGDPDNVSIDSFSVGILENAHVGTISYDDYQVSDGVAPYYQYFSPSSQSAQSAIWLFLPDILPFQGSEGLVGSGQHSDILLFSSNNGPTNGFGILEGGSIGEISAMPTPVPEPATIALLVMGGVMTLARKRRHG